ncbi:MAG: CDC27 family protein [Candidatus Hydrogenedentes bacterium]|nr:CDC27 family protein [Candidatus Hydrogenedentota bacterium]
MDTKEKIKDIVVCECGARISVSPTSKGVCPACGKQLNIRSTDFRESESGISSSPDPQDSPPLSHQSSPSVQVSHTHIPMPDDGLDPAGKSFLTFASDVKIRSREAANLVSRGKIIEAIALYRWICEEHPEHRDAYYGLGYCYYKLGDFQRSKWMLEKAMELEHPNASKLLAKVCQKIEQGTLSRREISREDESKIIEGVNLGDFLQDERK